MTAGVSLPTDTADDLSRVHKESDKTAIALFLDTAIFDEDRKYHSILMVRTFNTQTPRYFI